MSKRSDGLRDENARSVAEQLHADRHKSGSVMLSGSDARARSHGMKETPRAPLSGGASSELADSGASSFRFRMTKLDRRSVSRIAARSAASAAMLCQRSDDSAPSDPDDIVREMADDLSAAASSRRLSKPRAANAASRPAIPPASGGKASASFAEEAAAQAAARREAVEQSRRSAAARRLRSKITQIGMRRAAAVEAARASQGFATAAASKAAKKTAAKSGLKAAAAKVSIPIAAVAGGFAACLIVVGMMLALVVGIDQAQKGSGWGLEGLSDNEAAIAAYLRDKGLDKVHVAAIMGNLKQESSCSPLRIQVGERDCDPSDPISVGAGGGVGLVQWGSGIDGGRGNEMDAWARACGRRWTDIRTQLDWMWSEMTNEGPAANQTSWYWARRGAYSLSAFEAISNVGDAVEYWEKWMEAAGVPMMENRIRYANEYLALFNSGSSATGSAAVVVEAAKTQLGVPYVWGGTAPGVGLDCSGLTQWAYRQAGIELPRTTYQQIKVGTRVDVGMAQPGDLVFMNFSAPGTPEHVGIYLGGGQMIHAPRPGEVVKIGPVYDAAAQYYRIL